MIIRNSAKCGECGDEIESTHRHDFVDCSCGNIFVDGGRDYIRHGWRDIQAYSNTSISKVFETLDELLGRLKNIHKEGECRNWHCIIHAPSDHHMRTWPVDWQDGIKRVCPHGETHPDPDGLLEKCYSCDGCCEAA